MRFNFQPQPSLLSTTVGVEEPERLREILDLIEDDIKPCSEKAIGRRGMSCWETLVLASVRLGCDLDCDQLADLA